MGVDISLHIEIRRQNQWHLMSVSCPLWEQHDHEYKIFDTQVYNVRYYHFRDFLDEALTTFGYPHISTSDIRLFYLIC